MLNLPVKEFRRPVSRSIWCSEVMDKSMVSPFVDSQCSQSKHIVRRVFSSKVRLIVMRVITMC